MRCRRPRFSTAGSAPWAQHFVQTAHILVQAPGVERAPVAAAHDPDYLLSVCGIKLESDPLLKDLPLRGYGNRVVPTIPAPLGAAQPC